MKKKFAILTTSILALLTCASLTSTVSFGAVNAADESRTVDYSKDKWTDTGTNSLWNVDSDLSIFEFYTNSDDWSKNYDIDFIGNLLLTDQFDTRGAKVTLEATFQGSTTSQEIIDNDSEVHIGIIPWYKDSDNWVACYAKFSRCDDNAQKDGHIFDVQVYAKIDGSVHVEYYVKDDGNRWIGIDDEDNNEWHSCWPDRVNTNKNPSSLQDCEPNPSEELTIKVRKTRKTYAGKDCDSFYVTVNDYELNFGLDNFMFSGLKLKEDEDESFVPKVGFYLYGTKEATVKDFSVSISHDEVLPLPTVEPLTNPVTSGTVDKKVKVPEFMAYNNDGVSIDYSLTLNDPDNETGYLDGDDYFIPTKVGDYQVIASATDEKGYTGTYKYTVKIKSGVGHIDTDVYNDIYTYTPKDTAITAAYIIFISVPVIIVAYIGFKVFIYFKRKGKEK